MKKGLKRSVGRLTDIYYLQDENERLLKRIRRLERELDEKTSMASVFAHKTHRLLLSLGMKEKEIYDYYHTI